ncbi:MAG: hypothetical protein NVSMB64_32040 [Candidatus Velthaea sp.]
MAAITLKPTLEKRMRQALDDAIELADLGDRRVPAAKIAESVFDRETELIEELSRPWITERLAWLIARRRKERWNAESPFGQMILGDPVFQGLPKTIFIRSGQRPILRDATLRETEDHLKLLRDRFKNNPRVKQFEAVVELHRKWAAVRRGISWSDAQRLEAEERAKR